MKKTLFLSILLSFFLVGCNAQSDKESTEGITKGKQIEPKVETRVNTEYDEDGNLIRYDSTYSYFYSNIEDNPILEDSIFNQFKSLMEGQFKAVEDPFFEKFFLKPDGKIMDDFYTDDFFSKHFQQQLQEMDSIKNLFFEQQFSKKTERL